MNLRLPLRLILEDTRALQAYDTDSLIITVLDLYLFYSAAIISTPNTMFLLSIISNLTI